MRFDWQRSRHDSIDFSGGFSTGSGSPYASGGFGGLSNFTNAGPSKGGGGYASVADMIRGQGSQMTGIKNNQAAGWTPNGGGQSGGYGAQMGGGYGFGGQGGYDPAQVKGLVDQQMQQNQNALNVNNSRWQQGNGYLQAAQQGYFNDPLTQGNNALAQKLVNNPDVLNQGVQDQIQANAANSIAAQGQAQTTQMGGILAANGQTDASSMMAGQNQIQRQGAGQLAGVQSNLSIQAALQNRQSEQAALQAGQGMAAQNYGVNNNMANDYMKNILYQKPFDLSPYLLGMQRQQGGGGYGQGFQQQAPQQAQGLGSGPGGGYTNGGVHMNHGGGTAAGFNWSGPGIINNDPSNMGYMQNGQGGTPAPQYWGNSAAPAAGGSQPTYGGANYGLPQGTAPQYGTPEYAQWQQQVQQAGQNAFG